MTYPPAEARRLIPQQLRQCEIQAQGLTDNWGAPSKWAEGERDPAYWNALYIVSAAGLTAVYFLRAGVAPHRTADEIAETDEYARLFLPAFRSAVEHGQEPLPEHQKFLHWSD